MKILMLTPYLPYPLVSGGQIRTYNLLKALSTKHEITLFALIKEDSEREHLAELKKYCSKIILFKRTRHPFVLRNILLAGFTAYPFVVTRNLPLGMATAIEKELSTAAYDLIHAETFYMMPNIPDTKIPIILAEQTIEYLGYQDYMKKANPLLRPILAIDVAKIVGTTIQWSDKRAYVSAKGMAIDILDTDLLVIGSKTHVIRHVMPLAPAGMVVYFELVVSA